MPAHDVEHELGGGTIRHQHRAGADRHRKRHRIAEPIGEEQFCGGEHHVVGLEAEHALPIELRRGDQAAVDVLDRLGRAGRAR